MTDASSQREPWTAGHWVLDLPFIYSASEQAKQRMTPQADRQMVQPIATIVGRVDDRQLANAYLIAVAPDLYAALGSLLRELEWVNEQLDLMPDDYAEALVNARSIMARARGEVL